jgi:hypothetical protein
LNADTEPNTEHPNAQGAKVMDTRLPHSTTSASTLPVVATPQTLPASESSRVLRNTYALLSLTLLFSAGVAAASVVA